MIERDGCQEARWPPPLGLAFKMAAGKQDGRQVQDGHQLQVKMAANDVTDFKMAATCDVTDCKVVTHQIQDGHRFR